MIFSSVEFFAFFAIVLCLLAAVRTETARRNILLVASYVFYGWWDVRFCLLILSSTIVDYVAANKISQSTTQNSRKRWLVLSIAVNLTVLGLFKYANFFLASLAEFTAHSGTHIPHINIILPIGISFYTFQTMSYTIDVYRGTLRRANSFRDFALFVAFFPQLVAGPIVRGSDFIPQLNSRHRLAWSNLRTGASLFLIGYIKKSVFADSLAVYVEPVFADPGMFSSMTCWLALIAYAGQIYYDFSGYSDMAIGAARMLGYRLPENFRHPYRSLNITEFWRRWHISLSGWLRDYLYVPLGGNRKGPRRTYINLAVTMLLGGLWHGAAWNFVLWGAMHGAGLAVHKQWVRFTRGTRLQSAQRFLWPLSWVLTFSFTLFTWVFFRAASFEIARQYFLRLFTWTGGTVWYYLPALTVMAIGAALHVGVVLRSDRNWQLDFTRTGDILIGLALAALAFYFSPVTTNPFIYFQF